MEARWQDPDDEHLQVDLSTSDRLKKFIAGTSVVSGTQYTERLRAFYASMHQPSWTAPATSVDKKSLAGLLTTTKSILSSHSSRLLPTVLDISPLPNLNSEAPSKSCITALEFQGNLALTGGMDKKLRLFRVGETQSTCETTAYFKDLQITAAHIGNGQVYVSGKRPFYYVVDVAGSVVTRVPVVLGFEKAALERMQISPDWKTLGFLLSSGQIPFVSTQSHKLLFQLQMNSSCLASAYLSDTELLTAGEEGDVYSWDLRMRRCVRRFHDEGNIAVTALAASEKYIVTGSTAGVVNVYDRLGEEFTNEAPVPVKTLGNLTTTVDGLAFNASGEVLVMWSRWKKAAARLVHMASLTVFANWPDVRGSGLSYPFAACFSEDSRYVGVGNDSGQALLFKLNHYSHS